MLHCPRCGVPLTFKGNELECGPGEMELSEQLSKRLTECYVAQSRLPVDGPFMHQGKPHPIGGSWFCPGCGVPMVERSTGDLRCPKCDRSLVEFIRPLIELHPHRRSDET